MTPEEQTKAHVMHQLQERCDIVTAMLGDYGFRGSILFESAVADIGEFVYSNRATLGLKSV